MIEHIKKAEEKKCSSERDDTMNVITNTARPCTIAESIIESCKEVKLMREGKIPKRNWADFKQQMKDEMEKED